MADYDSDSSGANDIETGVTLGYATKEPTGDDFSQLGGQPIWLDHAELPSGDLAKCRVCNGLLNALFQLNGDLPDRYPGHERRLYIFGCRRKQCRRKEGSIRGLRYSKVDAVAAAKAAEKNSKPEPVKAASPPVSTLGNTLFGVTGSTASASANPFGAPSAAASSNPFAKPSAASQPAPIAELTQTFADKAKLGASNTPKTPQGPAVPWPAVSAFPQPYPLYYIDADKEFLDPEPAAVPQQVRIAELEDEPGNSSGGGGDDKTTFESTMDKTFQKFADRLEQNPEQVLRYEFGGQPLLYSKTDAVGKAWPRTPRCTKCGGQRQFELQLTPHAITELEADDISLEGMDWGTVILAVCGNDCAGWNEEWVGVQWEETSGKKP